MISFYNTPLNFAIDYDKVTLVLEVDQMPELVLELKENQLIEMIKKLKDNDKQKILKFLEEVTWGKRFEELLTRIRQKTKGRLSFKEITKEVEEVRKKRYESRHRY